MTSQCTLNQYQRMASQQLNDSLSGRQTCRYCGAPIEFTKEAIAGIPAGYPLECDCVHKIYIEAKSNESKRMYNSSLASRVSASGIPERYQNATSDMPIKSCYLFGSVGVGKTKEACGILIKALKFGNDAMFVTTSDIQNANFEQRNMMFEKMKKIDVLCIDDLGKAETSEWSDSIAFRAIDIRYGTKKPTIITSNYSKAELANIIAKGSNAETASSIVSRLVEMCGKDIEIKGKDRRLFD